MFSLDQLDEVFSYHKWSESQVALGGAVRGTGKELARAILLSAPHRKGHPLDSTQQLANDCRERALHFVRLAVQEANAAITFDAAIPKWQESAADCADASPERDANVFRAKQKY